MNDIKFIVDLRTFSTIAPKSDKNLVGIKSNELRSKIRLDIDTLRKLTNYCNWIPLMRGYHLKFIEESFPGWEWNDFIPRLIAKKILEFNGQDNDSLTELLQGLYISSDIEAIQFAPTKTAVKIKVLSIRDKVKIETLEKNEKITDSN